MCGKKKIQISDTFPVTRFFPFNVANHVLPLPFQWRILYLSIGYHLWNSTLIDFDKQTFLSILDIGVWQFSGGMI